MIKLLAGQCSVQPGGGKYGMGDRIKARREAIGADTVFGVLDSDFVAEPPVPTDQPKEWVGSDGTHFGWRWQRKEMENYLINPAIVQRALTANAPPVQDYGAALEQARESNGIIKAPALL